MPADTSALEVKAVFTGRVEVDGETYFPPLLPCTVDMTTLPAISIPLPAGGSVALPLDALQGCDNAVYSLGEKTQANRIFIPLLHD
jgi:hypothetical protein